jgi:hypothetical protein
MADPMQRVFYCPIKNFTQHFEILKFKLNGGAAIEIRKACTRQTFSSNLVCEVTGLHCKFREFLFDYILRYKIVKGSFFFAKGGSVFYQV